MYLEFHLPRIIAGGPSGGVALWAVEIIRNELDQWSREHGYPHVNKIHKNTLRVTFNSDSAYSLFVLSWQPKIEHRFWADYRIITDLNNRTDSKIHV